MVGLFSLKVIKTEGFKTVLICDAELLGKKFTEDRAILDVSEDYYGGELVDEGAAEAEMDGADYISLVGERSVDLGIRKGFVHPEAVARIAGIPYALYVNTLF